MKFTHNQKRALLVRLVARLVFAHREHQGLAAEPPPARPLRHTPGGVYLRERRRDALRMQRRLEAAVGELATLGVQWVSDDLSRVEPWPDQSWWAGHTLAFQVFGMQIGRYQPDRDLQSETSAVEDSVLGGVVVRTATTINIHTDSTSTMSVKAGG